MLIQDLLKTVTAETPVVFQYDKSYIYCKIVHKHYQLARTLVAINDKVDYMRNQDFYRRSRDEIESITIEDDSDGHIPYILAKIKA